MVNLRKIFMIIAPNKGGTLMFQMKNALVLVSVKRF